MKTIDETRLETDLEYRFQFLAEFIGFGPSDVAAIHAAAPHLGPLVPTLVERTYDRLLSFSSTARHFLPRQSGFAGELPKNHDELSQSNPQIQFRKDHLTRYLMQLLGRAYDGKMISYLDMVGKIHTPKAGNQEILVPLVQMNALLGLISDILIDAIVELSLDPATTLRTIRAVNKLLWLQNDFVNRHYTS